MDQTNYNYIVYKLQKEKEDIFKTDINPQFAKNISYPKFSLGFHHYIHQSKDKMEIVEEFKGKKQVYRVVNPFEHDVDNYDKSIKNQTINFLQIQKQPNILTRAFYKLWEMILMFDLIPTDIDKFVSSHLAEGPGSFIQATIAYRDTYSKKSKNDKYYAITLHSEEKHVPALHKEFIKYYEKEKPQRLFQHKTYPIAQSGGSRTKCNGDLTNLKTIKMYRGGMNQKANLVTADGGFNWKHENTQEQEAFLLIIGQIITALNVQEKNGHFVLKLFETFTDITSKLLYVLTQFYKEVYITKPFTSRKSNSEKYVICKFFNNDSKNVKNLEKVLKLAKKNKDLNLISIFDTFIINDNFKNTIINFNTHLSNIQYKAVNETITFINNKNYYGDDYQTKRKDQIKANDFWTNKFLIKPSDYKKNKDSLIKDIQSLIKS